MTSTLKTSRLKIEGVCDSGKRWWQHSWSLSVLARDEGQLGWPPLGACGQSPFSCSVLSCLPTLSSLWAPWYQKRPAKPKYLKKTPQMIRKTKQFFLKGKLTCWDLVKQCSLCDCDVLTAMLVYPRKLKTSTGLKTWCIWVDGGSRVCGTGSAPK